MRPILPAQTMNRKIPVAPATASPRRGAAAVETAVVLSFVFIPLLMGFFEFGRVMQAGQVVTTASRLGVRSAVLTGSTETSVRSDVQSFVSSTLGVPAADVSVAFAITAAPGNPAAASIDVAEPKDLIQVTVTINYDDISVVTGKFMNGRQISSSAAMRRE